MVQKDFTQSYNIFYIFFGWIECNGMKETDTPYEKKAALKNAWNWMKLMCLRKRGSLSIQTPHVADGQVHIKL